MQFKLISIACFLFAVNGFAQKAKLILPIGHNDIIKTSEFSTNGKMILSASADKSVKVWNAVTGRIVNNFLGHKGEVSFAKFSFDAQRVLSYSEDDGEAILWDVVKGNRIKVIEKPDIFLSYAEFNSDGSKIAAVYEDSTLCLYDGTTGTLLKSTRIKKGSSEKAVFSSDGNLLFTIAEDARSAAIWSISQTGFSMKTELKDPNKAMGSGYFSPDGTNLIILNKDNTYRIWDLSKPTIVPPIIGKKVSVVKYLPDNSGFITVLENKTIEVFKIYKTQGRPDQVESLKKIDYKGQSVSAMEMSQDGKTLAVGFDTEEILWDLSTNDTKPMKIFNMGQEITAIAINREGTQTVTGLEDYTAEVWDIATERSKLVLEGHSALSYNENFNRDGSRIITLNLDNRVRIWDAYTGKLIWIFNGGSGAVNDAHFSPDGKSVITANNLGVTLIWDVLSGKVMTRLLNNNKSNVHTALFSSDGTKIITTSDDSTASVWRFDQAQNKWLYLHLLKDNSSAFEEASFSMDGQKILLVGKNKKVQIWDAVDWKLNGTINKVSSVAFSPDSKKIVTNIEEKPGVKRGIALWDAQYGHLLNANSTRLFNSEIKNVNYSPDGQLLVCVSKTNEVRIFDAVSLALISACKDVPDEARVWDVNVSSDNQKIVIAFSDNTARVWNVRTGLTQYILRGHIDDVIDAIFSPDNKTILTSSYDNFVKRWDASNGELLYSFVPIDKTDYLLLDKYERWDGSPAARNLLYITCGTEEIQLEQFEHLGWEPDLISKVMGINKNPITAQRITDIPTLCNYTPLVFNNGYQNGGYQFTIVPRTGGVSEVSLKLNGKLLKVYQISQLTKANDGYHLNVNQSEIEPYLSSNGKNQILVVASSANRTVTSRGGDGEGIVAAPIAKSTKLPDLYLIAIGINEYNNPEIKLRYASSDAVNFASALSASARNLLNSDGKDHVKTAVFASNNRSSGDWPAKTAIRNKLNSIAQSAGPDDILVIFYAGHGTSAADEVNRNQTNYYLLTADNTSFDMRGIEKQSAISTQELEVWMRNIKAQKQVLIMDACHSGQGLQNLQSLVGARGDLPADQSKAIEQLKDNTGTYLLAASSSSQLASELKEYEQGVLTYSLLSGIKNQMALDQNKYIDLRKWFNSAKDFVSDLALQNKNINQVPQILGDGNYKVGMVNQAILDGIKLISKKKVVAHANFYDGSGSFVDPLLFSNELDKAFNEESAKVTESPFVFVSDNSSPEAFSVRGIYEINGNNIVVNASLIQGQTVVKKFTKAGASNNKNGLAKMVVDEVVGYLKTVNK
jgi:WD40 repeat protein/uncharacterized caspase-like protein